MAFVVLAVLWGGLGLQALRRRQRYTVAANRRLATWQAAMLLLFSAGLLAGLLNKVLAGLLLAAAVATGVVAIGKGIAVYRSEQQH